MAARDDGGEEQGFDRVGRLIRSPEDGLRHWAEILAM